MGVTLLENWQGTGQAREETGEGTVTRVEHEDGKRNARVEIKATHVDLREPVTGWLDTQAVQPPPKGAHVAYRIVVHRRRGVDPALPLEDVGRRERVRDLVELRPVNGQHPQNGHQEAPGAPQIPDSGSDSPPDPSDPQNGPDAIPAGMAWEALRAAEAILRAARPDAAPAAVTWMARQLLAIADEVDGAPDALTAIRAVATALAACPFPFDGGPEDRQAWRTRLRDHASTLAALAGELTEGTA